MIRTITSLGQLTELLGDDGFGNAWAENLVSPPEKPTVVKGLTCGKTEDALRGRFGPEAVEKAIGRIEKARKG